MLERFHIKKIMQQFLNRTDFDVSGLWQLLLSSTGGLLIALILYHLGSRTLNKFAENISKRTRTTLDKVLVGQGFFRHLGHFPVIFFVAAYVQIIFAGMDYPRGIAIKIVELYILYAIVKAFLIFLSGLSLWSRDIPHLKDKPVNSFVQAGKVVVVLTAGVILLSILLNRSPILFLSGLGALTAVLLLIFKDSILGLVASVQISALDLVRPGDWIEMPKFEADGNVMDVSLTTIRVQNWDRTITSIPSYALISESFKNWRGMEMAGGRRIKRALILDIDTVAFLTPQQRDHLRQIELLKDYLDSREQEIETYNVTRKVNRSNLVNGRQLTNVGCFRAYTEAYLKNHPDVHQEMILMVRQLSATQHGLPIEVYAFSRHTQWVAYEKLQADIFDHLYAAVPQFDLRVLQQKMYS